MTDEVLLKGASRGDETAFLLLYERHRRALFGFAYRLLGNAEAASEVVEDCFLNLVKDPVRFDPTRASLRTYLLGAARNLAISQFRRDRKVLDLAELPEEPPAAASLDPLGILLESELSERVREAVSGLSPLQREAVILFEYEELSLAEIAAVVEADVGTVKARLHRAREQLRRALAAYVRPRVGHLLWRPAKHER